MVAVVVGKGVLVVRIADVQCTTGSRAIEFLDLNNTVRLTTVDGVIDIGKPISIRVSRLRK